MKNLLTQWETEEENLRINLMKNLLTQWEIEEENRKIDGNLPLIDRKLNGNMLFIDKQLNSNMLLINREPVELEDDAKCASLPKLTELVKKSSNLTRTGKKKPQYPISYPLTCFVELVGWPCFCFVEGLTGLTDGLAISGAKSRREKVAIGFSG